MARCNGKEAFELFHCPDDVLYSIGNLGARDCDSENTAVYMIDVVNRMCFGGCATYLLPV